PGSADLPAAGATPSGVAGASGALVREAAPGAKEPAAGSARAVGAPALRAGNRRGAAGGVEAEPVTSRDVVVRITGAMGGTLRIDGAPVQWFGNVHHALTLGSHRFEFVAPDSTCC